MRNVKYPTLPNDRMLDPGEIGLGVFRDELQSMFPDWPSLMRIIDANDERRLWMYLEGYVSDLCSITLEDIIAAAAAGELDALVAQAKRGIELRRYLPELRRRYRNHVADLAVHSRY